MESLDIKQFENRVIAAGSLLSLTQDMRVVSGSRMLVSLLVLDADPGAVVSLNIQNNFMLDAPFETIGTMSVAGTGREKKIFSDFHNFFKFVVTVTGGNAEYRVAVSMADNGITTRIENAQISVDVTSTEDSVAVGDRNGMNFLKVNADGSINVNVSLASDESAAESYNEIAALPSGIESAVLTYVVPVDKLAYLYRLEAGGENIAKYRVLVNGTPVATRRTYFGGDLTTVFEFFTPNKQSLVLQPGDTVTLMVSHNRPFTADFEARAQLLLKDSP